MNRSSIIPLAVVFSIFIVQFLLLDRYLQAAVYKQVDEQGNVSYSDAPATENGHKPLKLPGLSVMPALPPAVEGSTSVGEDNADQVKYRVTPVSPANDAALRSNNGLVVLKVALEPPLQVGHQIQWFMDGVLRSQGEQTTIELQNMDRGTHTWMAAVVNRQAQVLSRSEAITFHLLRYFKTS